MTLAYRFSLAGVLRLRVAEYEQAATALARANAHLRELIAARDAELARYRSLEQENGAISVSGFLGERQRAEQAAASLFAMEARVNVAAAEAALSRIAWTGAHQKVSVLERLDSRRREEWMGEVTRIERLELDEIATAKFTRELQEQAAEA